MTAVELLEALKRYCGECLKDMLLPLKTKMSETAEPQPINIFKMRIPFKDGKAEKDRLPFILLQLLNGGDADLFDGKCVCTVRMVIAAYSNDAEEGSLYVLNVIERLKNGLLKQLELDSQYTLTGIPEYSVYPDTELNIFAGEMLTEWELPAVRQEFFQNDYERN